METILLALLADCRFLESLPEDHEFARQRHEYERYGVRHYLGRWLGHAPTAAQSAVFSRTLRSMAMFGLVERVRRWGGQRSTHVRLTPLGRSEAERLHVEREAQAEALTKDLVWDLDDLAVVGTSD